MLIIKLFASIFFAVSLTSSAWAALLSFEGLTSEARLNFNSIASNYDAFNFYNDAAFTVERYSYFYSIASNDGGAGSDFSMVWFGCDEVCLSDLSVDAPSSLNISDLGSKNNLTGSEVELTIKGAEIYIDANSMAVNPREFSSEQHFTVDNITFDKTRRNVPDPSSFFLLGIGILALAAVRRKSVALF